MGITASQRKSLFKVLAAKHQNLMLHNWGAFLLPVHHVLTGVLISSSRFSGRFHVSASISPLYQGFRFFSPRWEKEIKNAQGSYCWHTSDTENAEHFVDAFSNEILPLICNLGDLAQLERYQAIKLDEPELPEIKHGLTLIALGQFDEAEVIWEDILLKHPFLINRLGNHDIQPFYRAILAIRTREWHNLGVMMRESEKKASIALGVVEHWKPALFPFEEALGLTLPEA